MIWLMMNAAMKPPIMLPSPPSTQIMKISGPNVLPMKGCTSYCSAKRQAPRPASAPPIADVTRDAPLIDAHESDDLAVLSDRANGGADIGALEEEIERGRSHQRHAEGQQARVADIDAADLDDRQPHPDVAEVGGEKKRGEALQEVEQAAGGEKLVDRRRAQNRCDDQDV